MPYDGMRLDTVEKYRQFDFSSYFLESDAFVRPLMVQREYHIFYCADKKGNWTQYGKPQNRLDSAVEVAIDLATSSPDSASRIKIVESVSSIMMTVVDGKVFNGDFPWKQYDWEK